jgi:methylase of polypeptide subunit release factors
VSAPRFIQHKKEAFWFYRFLSIVDDHVINPGHWTEDMRDYALEPADLYSRHLKVVDVGGGTGFIIVEAEACRLVRLVGVEALKRRLSDGRTTRG